jgi:hypothetical protein
MHHINKGSTKAEIIAALKAEGYDADDTATRDELLTLLSQLTGTDYDKFSSSKAAPEAAEAKRVKIIIPSGETAVNQGDVYVGYNGKGYLLQRDTEVEVPAEVADVLRRAKQTIGIQLEDGSLQYREVLSYPFNVVG